MAIPDHTKTVTPIYGPGDGGVVITPSDVTTFAVRAIQFFGTGTVVCKGRDGNNFTVPIEITGTRVDIQCTQVLATGTTFSGTILGYL